LKKALYKTNAWFKGILFKFCDASTLLREISVIESLISKMSIPVISSAVAIIKLTEHAPTTATIHYLKAFINKAYNLPRKVITGMVNYFLSFHKVEE
jgi:essential nuclear protein 1